MTILSTNYLPVIKLETGINVTHTVLWMHGLGANGNDFVPIVKELKLSPEVHVRFIFPHAPARPVTINNGFVMRAWYDICHSDLNSHEDKLGIRDSQKAIDALIEREILNGIASERIILAGFSQGGAMALHVGLRYEKKLAGIIALSCYLPLAETLSTEAHPANVSVPILMMHGIHDLIVPISQARMSRELLLAANYQVKWHEYTMEHSVCINQIEDISTWLNWILQSP